MVAPWDAVAARFRPDIDDGIADAAGRRIENLVLIGDADGHRIDDDIAVIGFVEIGFAAHGRYPDAIAVPADTRDNALDQMLHFGMFGATETQRVHVGHGPRAHGEYVAQYTAHAGRRALIGFDITGMVVALHLENRGQPRAVRSRADIDHARILAGAANHLRAGGGQFFQVEPRGFIGAVLRPHDRKYAEFDHIGLTAHGG